MSIAEITGIVSITIVIITNIVIVSMFAGRQKTQAESLATQIEELKKTFEKEITAMKDFFNFRLIQIEEDKSKREKFEMEFNTGLSKLEESVKSAHHRIAEIKAAIKK
jgi:hypothetical protein